MGMGKMEDSCRNTETGVIIRSLNKWEMNKEIFEELAKIIQSLKLAKGVIVS